MRPIGGELVTTTTSPSCWGTHFLCLSNPPSGNLLPIIPCVNMKTKEAQPRRQTSLTGLSLAHSRPQSSGEDSWVKSPLRPVQSPRKRNSLIRNTISRLTTAFWRLGIVSHTGEGLEKAGIRRTRKKSLGDASIFSCIMYRYGFDYVLETYFLLNVNEGLENIYSNNEIMSVVNIKWTRIILLGKLSLIVY